VASQTEEVAFALPDATEDIARAGGFIMPNSMGFLYEAAVWISKSMGFLNEHLYEAAVWVSTPWVSSTRPR
jgi:hypothetical protein